MIVGALPKRPTLVCLAAAGLLAVGAGLRLHALGDVPPGLHQDEASAGYEAWSLLHFGIDRNGFSWPVHFVSWGSGQNALYSWLAMPFIGMGGLTSTALRLPMALTGVLALFLMWKTAERAEGRTFALSVLFLLVPGSWHVMASRWALEANLLPFVLLSSVYLLSRPDRGRFHIQAAAVSTLALSVYAYGTAYAFTPLFLCLVFAWLALNRLAGLRRLLALAAIAFVVTSPIITLVAINSLALDTVEVLGVSVPRYTGPPRYESVCLPCSGDWWGIVGNAPRLAALLLGGGDDRIWNRVPGYGALPPFAMVLGLFGLGTVLYRAKAGKDYGPSLLVAFWFIAAFLVASITDGLNINRMNTLWLPAIFLIALGARLVCRNRRIVLHVLVAAYVAFSGTFLHRYFGDYRDLAAVDFRHGFAPALDRALSAAGSEAIHLSGRINGAYALALLHTRTPPREYLETSILSEPNSPFSRPLAFGQFVFVSPPEMKLHPGSPRIQALNSRGRQLLKAGGIDVENVAHHRSDGTGRARTRHRRTGPGAVRRALLRP